MMRIIAVDNEWLQLRGLKQKIRKVAPDSEINGFRLPTDAIAYAKENPVDVAFLDMEMPIMHGLTLATKLQKINPKINIIFIAAVMDYVDGANAFEMHASGYLLKPVSEERISDEIQNLRYPLPQAEQKASPASGSYSDVRSHRKLFNKIANFVID